MPPNLGNGYRPPFDSETGRIAGLKSAAVRRARQEATEALTRVPTPDEVAPLAARLTLLRQCQTRLWRQVLASNDATNITLLVAAAKEAFDQEQRLLGKPAPKVSRNATPAPSSKPLEPIAAQATPTAAA